MTDVQRVNSGEVARAAPSARLRLWLIILSVIVALAFVAAFPSALFATDMILFHADPNTPAESVWNMLGTVWAAGAGFYVLLIAGVVGGWIAHRKRRSRLSFGLSLLAAVPLVLVVAAAVTVVLLKSSAR